MRRCRLIPVCLALVLLIAAGCGSKRAAKGAAPLSRPFPGPDNVPSVISSQEEKLAWISEHYWDNFLNPSGDWTCDSTHVNGVDSEALEEAFGTWISLIENLCPLPQAQAAATALFDRAEAFGKARPGVTDNWTGVFEKMASLASKYLYDPNSPARNEDIYLPFVTKLAGSPSVPDSLRGQYSWEAKLCSLNRTGSVAADFRFLTQGGRTLTLHGIKAPCTLLIFSNPGCRECSAMIADLTSSSAFNSMVEGKSLAVVDVYIDDDINHWKEHVGEYPHSWTCGYDPDGIIRKDLIYGVRAIPSLYLLDSSKRVLLKDAPTDRIIQAIENIND